MITVNLTAEATREEVAAVEAALTKSFPGQGIEIATTGLRRSIGIDGAETEAETEAEVEQVIDSVLAEM